MGAHTPLPWSLDAKWAGELHGADDTLIALLLGSEQSFQQWEIDPKKAKLGHSPERHANAAFIVRACNSHYELLEALEFVRANLGDPVPIGRRHIARRVDAAIAKARGQ